jgi:hypothetical protein
VGGDPGNTNTLTFTDVEVPAAGTYAMTVRYSNQEQSPATHYNPDPLARYAHISVNGGAIEKVPFPHSFHQNNFWDLTVFVELDKGTNTIRFSSEEKPNFDGVTYASDDWPDVLLRSKFAPNLDKITITPATAVETDELDVTVEATPRCLAGKAYLAVRATNNEDGPVDITVTTPFGTKEFADVAPGKAAYQSFNSRGTSVDAGGATWEVTRNDESTALSADHEGIQCG